MLISLHQIIKYSFHSNLFLDHGLPKINVKFLSILDQCCQFSHCARVWSPFNSGYGLQIHLVIEFPLNETFFLLTYSMTCLKSSSLSWEANHSQISSINNLSRSFLYWVHFIDHSCIRLNMHSQLISIKWTLEWIPISGNLRSQSYISTD